MDENNQEEDVKIVDAVIDDDNNQSKEKLNPWFSMLNKPRETIQQIIDEDPRHQVIAVSALGGLLSGIVNNLAKMNALSVRNLIVLVFVIILSPLFGIIGLYLGGLVYRITGQWLNGKGTPETIRTAVAWGTIPFIWSSILCFITIPLHRLGISFPFFIGQITFAIWGMIVVSKSLAQVQGFKSAWMGFFNAFLGGLLILVPIFVIVIIIALATRPSFH